MLDKRWQSCVQAVADIPSGARILVSGFGEAGVPLGLVRALAATDVSDLTLVANNAGVGDDGIAALI